MLNIVIPMAGAGSRFSSKGYQDPKPLIKIHGKSMIEVVVKNLTPVIKHRFIFICQNDHIVRYNLKKILSEISPNCIVVGIDGVTDGAARTVLHASSYIDNHDPLMIANSDQYVDININNYLSDIAVHQLDGCIMTMTANDPKWSYVELSHDLNVKRVVEKEVISNEATVGIYNYKSGSAFVSAANAMIQKNMRVNNEFYVAPAYNVLIEKGMNFGIYNIGRERDGMYGLGTPDDLEFFIGQHISWKAIK